LAVTRDDGGDDDDDDDDDDDKLVLLKLQAFGLIMIYIAKKFQKLYPHFQVCRI